MDQVTPSWKPTLAKHLSDMLPDRKPLRVGILLESVETSVFNAEVIRLLLTLPWVTISRIVLRAPLESPAPRGAIAKALGVLASPKKRRRLLYTLYDRVDRQRIAPQCDPFARASVQSLIAGIPTSFVKTDLRGSRERFPEVSIQELRDDQLDVVLRLGFGIIEGGILSTARLGVWSFHHGDSVHYRGAPPGVWELIEGNRESGVVLQRLSEVLDGGELLGRAIYPSVEGLSAELSAAHNRLRPYWGGLDLLTVALRRAYRVGEANAVPCPPYRGRRRLYVTPNNGEVVRWLTGRTVSRVADRLAGRTPIDTEWKLAVRRNGGDRALGDTASYTVLDHPPGTFRADPCVVDDGDASWVFYEDWRWNERIGRISVGRLTDAESIVDAREVLRQPYHLSFPFVFRHDGTWFMIPESRNAKQVVLWRARSFPDDWVVERVLLDEPALDTVVHQHEGHWYLFTSLAEPRSDASVHCLFHSESLEGSWRLHPATPLSTTLHAYRSAGNLFMRDHKLIRPVQSAMRGYGTGLEWREIVQLSPETFVDREIDSLARVADFDGGHSYSASARWEVIDLCWQRGRRSPKRRPRTS